MPSIRCAAAVLMIALVCPHDGLRAQAGRSQPLAPPVPPAAAGESRPDPLAVSRAGLADHIRVPPAFEQNRGQFGNTVAYLARVGSRSISISTDGVVTSGVSASGAGSGGATTLHLVGARRVAPAGTERAPGRVRYVVGSQSAQWIDDVSLYRQVRLGEVYPGIDWEWHVNDGSIEYDFVVRPGADPRRIALAFAPAASLRVVHGSLMVTAGTEVTEHRRPVAYQTIAGRRRDIAAAWRIRGSQARFALGAYDRRFPLTIDPVLAWSTFVPTSLGQASDVAVAADGSIFVAGGTTTYFNPAATSREDVFVEKLTSGGDLVYITYFGGSGTDYGPKIAVSGGLLYFAGATASSDFPMVAAAQPRFGGGLDGYAGALRVDGGFAFSTYLGGSSADHLDGVAAAPDGTAWMTGTTSSSDWPTVSAAADQQSLFEHSAVIVHMSPAGQIMASAFSGNICSYGHSVAVTADGNVYLAGSGSFVNSFGPTRSCESITTGRLSKYSFDGHRQRWSAALAGTRDAIGVGVTPDGSVWVTGSTDSPSMPTTADAADRTCGSDGVCNFVKDVYVQAVDSDGRLTYSTYLGGAGYDSASALTVDLRGQVWAVGTTNSTDWPGPGNGAADVFIVRFDGASHVVNYQTRFGLADNETPYGVVTNAAGAYIAGATNSPMLPAQRGGRPPSAAGFVAHFASLAEAVFIDHPADNGRVLPEFVIDGWAIDDLSATGTGIDAVHVWAFSLDDPATAPWFLGVAEYGRPRADVGNAFGDRYTASGYRLAASLPGFGRHLIGVYGRSTTSGQFRAVRTVTVNAVDFARVTIDAPASGAQVTSPLTVAGWALNPETPPSGGTGIDGIDVWAFPQAGGSAVFVGAAQYGVDRQDVATQYGPQFRYSGYRLTTSHLWAGDYTLAAYPHYAGTARYGAPAVSLIHLAAGPMVWVDQPAGSTTIGQPFTVSGWALDRRVSGGTGIDQVLVYARRLRDGTYVYLGAAQSGQPRPDVGSALGRTSSTPDIAWA